MKKVLSILLVAVLGISLTGCGSATTEDTNDSSKTVQIEAVNGSDEMIMVDYPLDPQRVVVLNYQTLDFLDAVGLGDRVVGTISDSTMPEHLHKYMNDPEIAQLGGMKEYDMEKIMELEPDMIFSSDRSASNYDEFVKIAPTFAAYIDYEKGFFDSYKELATKHATIFNVGDKVDATIDGYEERIVKIAEVSQGKSAMLLIFAGGLNVLGDDGRASIVTNEMGFKNMYTGEDVNHGNISSYEGILEQNPEYIFVLDKDTAVGEDSTAAKQQMDNEVIQKTDAYKNDKIIYLEPGNAWYLADGGITSMDLMITNIEEGLGIK